MTLDGIEGLLVDKYHRGISGKVTSNQRSKYKVNFVRYADDFIVTANSERVVGEIKELIKNFLGDKGLELSDEKTLITHIDNGFDFIGWNFRKYKGKLLIKPSKKSIHKVSEKISNTIKKGKTWSQEALISALNPIITGWSNYHQSVVSKKTFSLMDSKIWNMLWKWAKRRHPNKSRTWIAHKYWHSIGNRKWVFATKYNQLKLLSDKRIVRHTSLTLNKNPYTDTEYFHTRKLKQGLKKLSGRFRKIWENQKGKCPFCNLMIDINNGGEERPLHHKNGNHDDNRVSNLVYTHVQCHRQHHATNPKITAALTG